MAIIIEDNILKRLIKASRLSDAIQNDCGILRRRRTSSRMLNAEGWDILEKEIFTKTHEYMRNGLRSYTPEYSTGIMGKMPGGWETGESWVNMRRALTSQTHCEASAWSWRACGDGCCQTTSALKGCVAAWLSFNSIQLNMWFDALKLPVNTDLLSNVRKQNLTELIVVWDNVKITIHIYMYTHISMKILQQYLKHTHSVILYI